MAKIKTIEGLRDEMLKVFEDLSSGKIDIQEAGIKAKISETIISGVKTEIDYARLTESKPNIPFLGNNIKQIG
jgi:hypothetical protein